MLIMKYSRLVTIQKITKEAIDAFIIEFIDKDIALASSAGMFISIGLESKMFRRPFAILDACKDTGLVRFLFRVVGASTAELSKLKAKDSINIMAPLGNSFIYNDNTIPILIAGGVGVPPIHYFAKSINNKEKTYVLLGGSNSDSLYMKDELKNVSNLHIATDDGSVGFNGNVVMLLEDILKKDKIMESDKKAIIYACGPLPMLKGLRNAMDNYGIKGYFSFEAMMSCAIGLCQGCALPIEKKSKDNMYSLCCRDGSIFEYDYIEL